MLEEDKRRLGALFAKLGILRIKKRRYPCNVIDIFVFLSRNLNCFMNCIMEDFLRAGLAPQNTVESVDFLCGR